jgi:hypothetical protein
MLVSEETLFYAACGGLILGLACTLNYMLRGKETGMTRIAYNISTLNKCKCHSYSEELPGMLTMLGGMWTISSLVYLIYGNGSYGGFEPFGP